jgi:hypothetical protein
VAAFGGFDVGSKFTNTPVVDKTIAEIVPHAREDQASTRLDVGTLPTSARRKERVGVTPTRSSAHPQQPVHARG